MKRLASEVLRDLQVRVARLEKKAGPGAGVNVFLSGKSRDYRVLKTELENNLSLNLDWHEIKDIKGSVSVYDVSLTSYYDSKHCHGLAGIVSNIDFKENLSDMILDKLISEEVLKRPKVLTPHIYIYSLENTMIGGGYMRGSAPKEIEVKGEAEVLIEFEAQDGDIVEFYESDLEFTAKMKTSDTFRDAFDALDSGEDSGEFDY
jgi:hypothetical protein